MFEVNKEKIERVLKIIKILSSMKRQIISLPYFSQEEITSLIECCSQFKFREATPLTKTGVIQDFSVCFPAPKVGALKKCIDHFNLLFADPKLECFFSSILNFNDIAVQKSFFAKSIVPIIFNKIASAGVCFCKSMALLKADSKFPALYKERIFCWDCL